MASTAVEEGWPTTIGIAGRSRGPLRRFVRDPKAVIGVTITVAVSACGLFPAQLAPYSPIEQRLGNRLQPPTLVMGDPTWHVLGTDQLGRDLLSRLIHASQISLIVAATAVLLGGAIGVFLGLLAGYYGDFADRLAMRATDVALSLPVIILALALVAFIGTGLSNVILALGLSGWPQYARVVRGQVMSVRETDYILAARALGAWHMRVVFRHILPNVAAPVIVLATLQAAHMILAEASLSYLGVGVQPPTVSWGLMVAAGRDVLDVAWWIAVFPGIAIMLAVVGFNFSGDFFREMLDPRSRRRT